MAHSFLMFLLVLSVSGSAFSPNATVAPATSSTGNIEMVDALVRGGADVNARQHDGATALSMARMGHHAEVAELLKAAGAKE